MSKVSVIVPLKGHPVLLEDALESVAREMAVSDVIGRVIVVDDGCTFAETRASLASWKEALGDKMVLRHYRNGGLSAARNRGLALAFEADPDLDAVFMLDADNRLVEGASATMAQLLAQNPQSDWFYPQFDFFGQTGHYITDSQPNLLFHALANHADAGSLIRARVFAEGLQFDEAMRGGYEDWDFWLQAQRDGFKGQIASAPLLAYRKRPISMLSGSHERDAELRLALEAKHQWLYNGRKLLELEAQHFPRFALIVAESDEVQLFTDPDHREVISLAEYERRLYASFGDGFANAVPSYLVVMRQGLEGTLSTAKLWRNFFWLAQRRQLRLGFEIDQFFLERISEGRSISNVIYPAGQKRPDAVVLTSATLEGLLRADTATKIRSLDSDAPQLPVRNWAIGLEALRLPPSSAATASELLRDLLLKLSRSPYRAALAQNWEWRAQGGALPRHYAEYIPRRFYGGAVLPLLKKAGQRDVAFVLQIVDFGGVEKVAASLAREMKADGWRCHLVVLGDRPIRTDEWVYDAFDSLNWQPDGDARDWSGPEYLGTNETRWGTAEERGDLVGLLGGMDVVINAHAAGLHKVANQLRRLGVVMINHEHLVERSSLGRPYGGPVLALAYESAYDRVLTCSEALRDWLHGEGIPREKLMAVVNAPGYPMPREEQGEALEIREREGALRVLYMGRFDQQKGIDRLERIYHFLAQAAPQIQLKAVGGRVVDGGERVHFPRSVRVEPPVREADAVTAELLDADVLILPSYYEGLPLSVLEAQRLGVVVVATDVGAMREAIEDGVTGILVPSEGCETAIVREILALEANPARLAELSAQAAARWRDWREASAPLRAWLEERMAEKENA